MNKKMILDHVTSKKTKKIDTINQQYNFLIVCVLDMLNPNKVE